MKKLIFSMLLIAFAGAAFAMPAIHGGGGFHGGGSRIIVVGGGGFYSPYYDPFYHPFGFNYGYNPYNSYRYQRQPSKLDMQVDSIKQDYDDRIKSVKSDDSLTKQERKDKVKEFKTERDQLISDTKKNYYKQ